MSLSVCCFLSLTFVAFGQSVGVLFFLRHAEIISILELLKCGISPRGVGRVPARTPPLAWFVAIIAVVCFAGICCLFCRPSHVSSATYLSSEETSFDVFHMRGHRHFQPSSAGRTPTFEMQRDFLWRRRYVLG